MRWIPVSPKRPPSTTRTRIISYRELDERASRLAGGLRSLGVEPTDRVLLRFPNRPEFVVAWFALQKLGAVVLATMPLLRARELEYVANDSQVKVALVSSDLYEELEKARPKARDRSKDRCIGRRSVRLVKLTRLADLRGARGVRTRCPRWRSVGTIRRSSLTHREAPVFPKAVSTSRATYSLPRTRMARKSSPRSREISSPVIRPSPSPSDSAGCWSIPPSVRCCDMSHRGGSRPRRC